MFIVLICSPAASERRLGRAFTRTPGSERCNNKKPKIKINKKDKILCAKFRKGHFEGVLDVMDRLTNIVKPNKIFMGEKDFQQLFLVKKYLKNKYDTEVIGCKTIRNKNKF